MFQKRKVKQFQYKAAVQQIINDHKPKLGQKKLHEVTFHYNYIEMSAFIKKIDPNIHSLDNTGNTGNFVPHLSRNRNLRQFRPYFEQNLDFDAFFDKILKNSINFLENRQSKFLASKDNKILKNLF